MQREESHFPADWLRIAAKDLNRVKFMLEVQDAEAAGFYLQQAVEKFLKAFLLSQNWKLKRIHDLEPLLNEAIIIDPSLEQFRSVLQKITGFYMVERYPLITEAELTDADVRKSVEEVQDLIDKLQEMTKGQ